MVERTTVAYVSVRKYSIAPQSGQQRSLYRTFPVRCSPTPASWAGVPWETREAYVVSEEEMGWASRIVLAHDLARGKLRRVTRWEWLTGITDDEREQLRRQLDEP